MAPNPNCLPAFHRPPAAGLRIEEQDRMGRVRGARKRQMNGEGRFEVWLAIDRHYLPVRMLRSEENGDEMELSVRSIAPSPVRPARCSPASSSLTMPATSP